MRAAADVDHFIPWARHPDNGIENLVVADPPCNGDKRASLASAQHVQRWMNRIGDAENLAEIAATRSWERHPERTVSVARSIYLRLPPEARLWSARRTFTSLDREQLVVALA